MCVPYIIMALHYTFYYDNFVDPFNGKKFYDSLPFDTEIHDQYNIDVPENKIAILKLVNYMKAKRNDKTIMKLHDKSEPDQKQLCENMVFAGHEKFKDIPEKELYTFYPTIIVRSGSLIVGVMLIDLHRFGSALLWEICAVPGYGRHCMLIVEHIMCLFYPKSPKIELFCVEEDLNGSLHKFYQKCKYIPNKKDGQDYSKPFNNKQYCKNITNKIDELSIIRETPVIFQQAVMLVEPIPSSKVEKFDWPAMPTFFEKCKGLLCIKGGRPKIYIKYNNRRYLLHTSNNIKYINTKLYGKIQLSSIRNKYRYIV